MNYKRYDEFRYFFQDKVKSEEHFVRFEYGLGYEFPAITCD